MVCTDVPTVIGLLAARTPGGLGVYILRVLQTAFPTWPQRGEYDVVHDVVHDVVQSI